MRMRKLLRFSAKHKLLVVGALLTAVTLGVAILAPLVAPHDPYDSDLSQAFTAPSFLEGGQTQHLLGTDYLGRDLLSRIIYSIRISWLISGATVLVSMCLGVTLGVTAGYFGGWLDNLVMRVTDVLLAIPLILLAITVIAVVGSGIQTLIAVIALTQWMVYARTARGETMSLREREYIEASLALGAKNLSVLWRHVIPNVLPSVLVLATLNLAQIIMLEAGLSYLGLGVQPPNPSLGTILTEGRNHLAAAWWYATFPGVVIIFIVMGINFLGDGLRDLLDPR